MKAVALISGGLDSLLAAKLIQGQGVEVLALHFQMPFCASNVKEAVAALGLSLKEVSIDEEFIGLILKPKHGRGSHMNPCIDCKILMLRRAKEMMASLGADFIITGEVLGQRPMSQHRQSLEVIERESGLEGLLLRPLSARLLAETLPEKKGWVKREELLAFNGRARKPQIDLADKLGIRNYRQPAGGCLLTDAAFSGRIKDLIKYNELTLDNIELLKIGRHFRLSQTAKLVVGRNEIENGRLIRLKQKDDLIFMPEILAGPTALGRGTFDNDLIELSCSIVSRYCDLNGEAAADIICENVSCGQKVYSIAAAREEQLAALRR